MFDSIEEIPSYVYKHTNKITKQFYFGSRCFNVKLNIIPEEDFKKYICSSKIKEEIKENKELWDSEILNVFYGENKKEDCFWFEQDLIKNNWGNPLLLNRQYKDSSKNKKVFLSDEICKESTKEKISAKNKGSKRTEEQRLKMSLAKLGVKRSEEVKNNMSRYRTGKKHKQESKDKVRDSKLGISRDEQTKEKISKTLIGRNHTEILKSCENCGRKMRGSNLTQHFPKCVREYKGV